MRRRRGNPRVEPDDLPLFECKVDTEIDLHGLTRAEAERQVRGKLQTLARSAAGSLVHIITGKGNNSVAGPVLRPAIAQLLRGQLGVYISRWESDLDDGGFLARLR